MAWYLSSPNRVFRLTGKADARVPQMTEVAQKDCAGKDLGQYTPSTCPFMPLYLQARGLSTRGFCS